MKLNFLHIICASALLLTACSEDDGLLPGADNVSTLSVTVTDGGYISETGSRAAENGYTTEFTPGDACGLYIIRNGVAVYDNVKLTAAYGTDGTLAWQPESGVTIAGGMPGERYFLYYPYQEDMSGKTDATATDDAGFFASLISDWQPATDQSDYAAGYTASDLMTATGTAAKADGKLSLNFAMTHRMALAVIEMPKTVYKFTNTAGESIPDYTVAEEAEINSEVKPYHANDGTYRCIVYPDETNPLPISGKFADNMKEFQVTPKRLTASSYKIYRIEAARSVEKSHNLQIGDYLLADGSIISRNATLTDEIKAKVAAVVFWSPAETNTSGRKTPANLTDDKLMALEHPNCMHGLAVAIKTIRYNGNETIIWQPKNYQESLMDWQNSDKFRHPHKDKIASIAGSYDANSNSNRIYGYQNTEVLRAYNNYCSESGRDSYKIQIITALDMFITEYPAPIGSTGWFAPSMKEVYIIYDRDVDDLVNQWPRSGFTQGIINPYIAAVGGDQVNAQDYWSTTEDENNPNKAFWMRYKFGLPYNTDKYVGMDVRAVCAF